MRKFVMVFPLLLCVTSSQAKDKTGPADYNLKVHISASHLANECNAANSCGTQLHADTTVNGIKIELTGTAPMIEKKNSIIVPGDYPARLTKDRQDAGNKVIYQEYDLMLPDSVVWHCYASGISE